MNPFIKILILIVLLIAGFVIAASFIKTLGEITGVFLFFVLWGLGIAALNCHQRSKRPTNHALSV